MSVLGLTGRKTRGETGKQSKSLGNFRQVMEEAQRVSDPQAPAESSPKNSPGQPIQLVAGFHAGVSIIFGLGQLRDVSSLEPPNGSNPHVVEQ